MKNALLILVLLITASFNRHDVYSSPDPLSPSEVAVGSEFDYVSKEPRVEFPVDDGRTMQLLKPGTNHDQLELNQMVLEKLAAIEEPLSFVSVVGPYHGGKSFLLNVLVNSTQGFSVGAVPDPETRGIWIRVVPKEKLVGKDGSRVVLVDTEGFYGEGATRSYDARIFAIATLMSSHLIYNTLRTIGDAQSVSALADLAKQAQVFNLQNWLHSAEAKSDQQQFSSPTNMDPFLLLKTLDFPPLTWVVQGFDMEVSDAHSPMDHLKRYLEAHAHSGDRTIDTLFTKGISCYTMRSPTDLNKLREEVGGEGLAAHTELYSRLHPNYLADAARLQRAVFGSLIAKGGFNGKTLAGILPLLVHYVNEDFPLNAERKLRDVLTEVVIDGAFSGGAQYFQMAMQNPTLPPGARGKAGEAILSKLERNDSLNLLVSTAFTAKELEGIMSAAETKAVEYCKQRCVGVPTGRIVPTCIAQLGAKIGRMKPKYREENERRVKQVLVELGDDLRLSAEREVEELHLPMRDADIERLCKQCQNRVLQGYESLVGPHRGSNLYNEARSQFISAIQTKCDKVSLINSEKITNLLNNAKVAYQEAYGSTIQTGILGSDGVQEDGHQKDYKRKEEAPIPPKRLLDIHKAAIKAGQEAFENFVKAAGLPWVGPGDNRYDFYLYTSLQYSKKQYDKLREENERVILAYVAMRAANLSMQFKEAVANITPFPDNDEVLSAKADQLSKITLEEFATTVKDYVSVSGVDDQRKDLISQIQETHARFLKKNTALMAAFCYDPLQEAYRELRMQECELNSKNIWKTRTWWSRKCLWPGPRYTFGFKYAAFSAAQKHLDRAQAAPRKGGNDVGVVLSPATRNKVIESWVEHDLARFSTTVFFNFSLLSAILVILITSVSWLFGRLGLSHSSKKPPIRKPMSSPSPLKKPPMEYSPYNNGSAFYPRSPNFYQ